MFFSFSEQSGRIHFADRKTGSNRKAVIDALNDAIDRHEEGIVLKDPESVYKPGVRSKGGWLKIKPEYTNELMDQCDMIILGGYYGGGKRGRRGYIFIVVVILQLLGDVFSFYICVDVCRIQLSQRTGLQTTHEIFFFAEVRN